jgi:hypothetical protein
MRLVPCICNHCGKGCQYAFAPVPHVPPSAPPRGAEGGEGEGEGRQVCVAAQTLKPLQLTLQFKERGEGGYTYRRNVIRRRKDTRLNS